MARILAIDYGRKRIGIAVTDTLQLIAGGLTTTSPDKIHTFLADYFSKEPVEKVIIGLPKKMNNEPSESMQYINAFVTAFKRKFAEMPIEFYDERFTSVLAHKTMLDAGLKKKDRQNKALVDEISATIILQSYLESKKYNSL